jgi:hypothetical protein
MGFRGDWPEREARPKARKLDAREKDDVTTALTKAIALSPVLTYFQVQILAQRGRFHVDWCWQPEDPDAERSTKGRITPLDDEKQSLLLEVEYRKGSWSEVTNGSAKLRR